jgi:hypothetical protein
MRDLTKAEWEAEGERRFGPDRMKWRFVCPVCKHVATPEDWMKSGAPDAAIAFSCVGRWIEGAQKAFESNKAGPCNYAGGGLFRLNPVKVDGEYGYFEFAD